MGEKELREQLGQINSEIQTTQKEIDNLAAEAKRRTQSMQAEQELIARIEKAQTLLKSLKDQLNDLKNNKSQE